MWHLLSLDAPTVALLWSALFSWNAHLSLMPSLTLALAVWVLYACDRLLDARRSGWVLQERHLFHQRHRMAFLAALGFAIPLLGVATFALDAEIRNAWLLLGIPLLLYFAIVHATRISLPKEAVVAVFFAGACSAGSAMYQKSWGCTVNVILFSVVCWANCIAIARWECTSEKHTHPLTWFAASRLRHICILLIVACAIFAPITGHPDVPICVLLSAALLLWLDYGRSHFTATTLRALADAVLLTPVLILPFFQEKPILAAVQHLLRG